MDPQAKEQHVHSVFESIAPKYDMMNDLISFGRHKAWRKFTMRKMAMKPGDTAIDLCCGTCDWTIDIAHTSKKGGIVGLDFSQAMLDVGKGKVAKLGLADQISLVQGNAMDLPFPDNHFDYATIGFGLRNVPDLVKVLQEMQRVVKPGGQVVCLEMSKPGWQPFKFFYYLYFQQIMPLIGKFVAKRHEQYKWLPESLVHFPDRERLAEIYREIGLQQVKAYSFAGGVAALHMGTKGTDKA
ncbi:demethylmenaquinone methyltransferase [Paenibacillus daejeonensis]|uniref:demethylmenaquinone methyltransferase n=1 Tax=Paenibacillus daejeonensis TaxID=135193 RepID=UPI000375CBF7|nr:demethylmenaquinone methyltransferase [Paenibacillus daejeonensis]